ncbi:unnamed protein product [Dovyalis caffra]|uniref:Uncharacterized protein n=1 Tax=Dovyalis caffra TaxID=77055 RepID=A0AAV1RJW2_9ROSI|nr:unnamed protein product [Dovyalis caffra]
MARYCIDFLRLSKQARWRNIELVSSWLRASIGRLDEETMTSMFIDGLDERIRAELFMLNPTSLKETMRTTTRIERKNQIIGPLPKPKEPPLIRIKPENKTISWTPTKQTYLTYPNTINHHQFS